MLRQQCALEILLKEMWKKALLCPLAEDKRIYTAPFAEVFRTTCGALYLRHFILLHA